jgi:hypothetical protein
MNIRKNISLPYGIYKCIYIIKYVNIVFFGIIIQDFYIDTFTFVLIKSHYSLYYNNCHKQYF